MHIAEGVLSAPVHVTPSRIPYNASRQDCINAFVQRAREYIGQFAETDQRVDHETGKHRECNCRNQTGDLSNTHLVPVFLCGYFYYLL